jgi:hypothetical protein
MGSDEKNDIGITRRDFIKEAAVVGSVATTANVMADSPQALSSQSGEPTVISHLPAVF